MSLEFQESFDPDKPDIQEEEQKQVSDLFEGIVDTTLLSFPDSMDEVVPDQVMQLDLVPVEKNTDIDSAIVVIMYNASHTDRYVILHHIKQGNNPKKTSQYRLYGGNSVRRFDTNDREIDSGEGESFLTDKEKFDQAIGINGRPVGLAEIKQLQTRLAGMLPK